MTCKQLDDCGSCFGRGEVYFGEYDSFSRKCQACGGSGKQHPDTARVKILEAEIRKLKQPCKDGKSK